MRHDRLDRGGSRLGHRPHHRRSADRNRWLLCGSIAVYFAISTLGGLTTGAGWPWLLGWGAPCTIVPLLLGAFGADLHTEWMIWIVALAVGWQILYRPIAKARATAQP